MQCRAVTRMDELTPEQEDEVAATVGAIQRIAMAIVALPKEQRAVHYALVRWKFEAAIREFGIEGDKARKPARSPSNLTRARASCALPAPPRGMSSNG